MVELMNASTAGIPVMVRLGFLLNVLDGISCA